MSESYFTESNHGTIRQAADVVYEYHAFPDVHLFIVFTITIAISTIVRAEV